MSPSQRSSLLASAIIYAEARANPAKKFKSAAEYTAYKKAQVVAASSASDPRPVQSVIVEQLREFCPS